MIDTRSLHKWLAETDFKTRILVMHHPLDWLIEWAKLELEKIISNSFQLVFSGHIHENSTTFSSRGIGKSVHCVAPPLYYDKACIYQRVMYEASYALNKPQLSIYPAVVNELAGAFEQKFTVYPS